MNRFATLSLAAAALAISALSAAPASAADVVVKLGGKSPDQISADLERAASRVCRDELMKSTLVNLTDCIDLVFNDAVAQLPASIVVPKR